MNSLAARPRCVSMASTLLLCVLTAVVPWTTHGAAVLAPTDSTRTADARSVAPLSAWLMAAGRDHVDRLRLGQVSAHLVDLKAQLQSKAQAPIRDCQPAVAFLKDQYMLAWAVARLYVVAEPAWSIFLRARAHAAAYAKQNPQSKTVCGLRKLVPDLERRALKLLQAHARCHKRKDSNCPLPPGGKFRKEMNGAEKATRARVVAVPLSKPLPKSLLPKRVSP
ncbi:hypothetical protein BU14_0614s0005 [Porphyra umbilicalis]|uniref:Uncharacterized protein n=1 Tax=Porphyra umbilicalis TaxID=2786 RepID=A0A1X6NR64_PORUM|nr:hypothetical protein BU14_0614s0005 [Porphyra umbilicalis]|eukprot:OSX71030.1 hypothetical protein BU14_0614s0005 [Porphyra umbilicalis]